jgi:hypothetical protein
MKNLCIVCGMTLILIFPIQIAGMLSSVKEVLHSLQHKFERENKDRSNRRQNWPPSSRRSSSPQKWNIDDLENLLNIVRDQAEQVEGNMQLPLAGAQRFLPFDNRTVDNIPRRK